jgi:hypothetical protein
MKKMRGDKPTRVIIHIYVELSQRISLHSYLYLQQFKISFFYSFSSTKSETIRAEQILPGKGVRTRGRER